MQRKYFVLVQLPLLAPVLTFNNTNNISVFLDDVATMVWLFIIFVSIVLTAQGRHIQKYVIWKTKQIVIFIDLWPYSISFRYNSVTGNEMSFFLYFLYECLDYRILSSKLLSWDSVTCHIRYTEESKVASTCSVSVA